MCSAKFFKKLAFSRGKTQHDPQTSVPTAREAAASARCRPALEAAVYNHLYAFFSRYWQDGDFISKRRYSRKERYAIPYNGEEVYLHWANHDQYYIKSGEYFNDYSWQAPKGRSVHFKLNNANVEQNNVKGEKRYFLPLLENGSLSFFLRIPAGIRFFLPKM